MLAYVLFGGMIATTWVQIVKAVLLLSGATLLAVLVLARFDFNPLRALRGGRRRSTAPACSRRAGWSPIRSTPISLGLALMLGTAGLPHILMRFYTVPDARRRASSVVYATAFIGFFYLLTSSSASARWCSSAARRSRAIDAGGNMAAPLLAEARRRHAVPRLHRRRRVRDHPRGRRRADAGRRGRALARPLGARRARAATPTEREQLARRARRDGRARRRCRSCSGIAFKGQNVAYMVGLAFAIAASANFPALVLSIFWQRLHDGGRAGEHARRHGRRRCVLIYLSPTIQVDILQARRARWFPLRNPGIVTIPLSFAVAIAGLAAAAGAGRGATVRRARATGCTWVSNSDAPGAGPSRVVGLGRRRGSCWRRVGLVVMGPTGARSPCPQPGSDAYEQVDARVLSRPGRARSGPAGRCPRISLRGPPSSCPEEPASWANLALAQLRLGDARRPRRRPIERALSLAPNRADILLLACAGWRSRADSSTRASRCLRRATAADAPRSCARASPWPTNWNGPTRRTRAPRCSRSAR